MFIKRKKNHSEQLNLLSEKWFYCFYLWQLFSATAFVLDDYRLKIFLNLFPGIMFVFNILCLYFQLKTVDTFYTLCTQTLQTLTHFFSFVLTFVAHHCAFNLYKEKGGKKSSIVSDGFLAFESFYLTCYKAPELLPCKATLLKVLNN